MISFSHEKIASLDPLLLDSFFLKFPKINEESNREFLYNTLQQQIPTIDKVEQFTIEESCAALRDLGMILSSIRKMEDNPNVVPYYIEKVLLALSRKTGMVPRDTAYHYGPWNPKGKRERRFTNLQDEDGLIEGVRASVASIEVAISNLEIITNNVIKRSIQKEAHEAKNYLHDSVTGISQTIKKTDPHVFSHELRPYFDPIMIGNQEYVGAGGGQIPLFIVDLFLWGSNLSENDAYAQFMDDSKNYVPGYLHELYSKYRYRKSIVDKLTEGASAQKIQMFKDNAYWINEILKVIIKFRKPHYQLARKTLSEENRGEYTTGSAGYTDNLVYYALQLTQKSSEKLTTLFWP